MFSNCKVRLRHVLMFLGVAAATVAIASPSSRLCLMTGDAAISLSFAAILSAVRHSRREHKRKHLSPAT